ncbi:hypothetical protein RB195_002913 [Necator americanus]|uniref:Uncharacterized protein n=1 Tax=Necator americanus TaxID=51031 RepID=A0ABR1DL82_NECAM
MTFEHVISVRAFGVLRLQLNETRSFCFWCISSFKFQSLEFPQVLLKYDRHSTACFCLPTTNVDRNAPENPFNNG